MGITSQDVMQKEETIWKENQNRRCRWTRLTTARLLGHQHASGNAGGDDGDDKCYVLWVLLRILNGVRFEFRVKQGRNIIPKISGVNPQYDISYKFFAKMRIETS
jgi:hypothetical protein